MPRPGVRLGYCTEYPVLGSYPTVIWLRGANNQVECSDGFALNRLAISMTPSYTYPPLNSIGSVLAVLTTSRQPLEVRSHHSLN